MNFKVERRDPPWVVFLFFMSADSKPSLPQPSQVDVETFGEQFIPLQIRVVAIPGSDRYAHIEVLEPTPEVIIALMRDIRDPLDETFIGVLKKNGYEVAERSDMFSPLISYRIERPSVAAVRKYRADSGLLQTLESTRYVLQCATEVPAWKIQQGGQGGPHQASIIAFEFFGKSIILTNIPSEKLTNVTSLADLEGCVGSQAQEDIILLMNYSLLGGGVWYVPGESHTVFDDHLGEVGQAELRRYKPPYRLVVGDFPL